MSPGKSRSERGLKVDGESGRAYSEEAFVYLLAIERRRAVRSGCALSVLLVTLRGTERAGPIEITASMAARLFDVLTLCVRETDFVGWYRSGRVAGAVMVDSTDGAGCRMVSDRVRSLLVRGFSRSVAERLRLRFVQLHPARETAA